MKLGPIPAWLDEATAALVKETVNLLIKRHSDILLAVILFGSIARHEERPPDDACPSDVDLLAIFDTTDRLVRPYREDIFATIIDACALPLDAPREVNVLLSDRRMQTWDSVFLDNLARDGMLLYARDSLPTPLASRQSFQAVLEDKGVRR